jgi:hypothetical protein
MDRCGISEAMLEQLRQRVLAQPPSLEGLEQLQEVLDPQQPPPGPATLELALAALAALAGPAVPAPAAAAGASLPRPGADDLTQKGPPPWVSEAQPGEPHPFRSLLDEAVDAMVDEPEQPQETAEDLSRELLDEVVQEAAEELAQQPAAEELAQQPAAEEPPGVGDLARAQQETTRKVPASEVAPEEPEQGQQPREPDPAPSPFDGEEPEEFPSEFEVSLKEAQQQGPPQPEGHRGEPIMPPPDEELPVEVEIDMDDEDLDLVDEDSEATTLMAAQLFDQQRREQAPDPGDDLFISAELPPTVIGADQAPDDPAQQQRPAPASPPPVPPLPPEVAAAEEPPTGADDRQQADEPENAISLLEELSQNSKTPLIPLDEILEQVLPGPAEDDQPSDEADASPDSPKGFFKRLFGKK